MPSDLANTAEANPQPRVQSDYTPPRPRTPSAADDGWRRPLPMISAPRELDLVE